MKKTLLILIVMLLAFMSINAFAEGDGALAYAESAPGGECTTVEELMAALGTDLYGEPNAELIKGSNTELRLKSNIILQNTLVIKSGDYTLIGGSCTIARSEGCGTAIDIQGGSLTIGREDETAEYGEGTVPNIIFSGQGKENASFITVSANAALALNSKALVKDMISSGNGAFICASGDAEVKIYASRFEGCKAKNGGAVYVSKSSDSEKKSLIIKKSIFEDCEAENGGAIYSEAYTYLLGCTLNKNMASGSGGAIYVSGSSEIQNLISDENKAKNGGVLYNSGACAIVELTSVSNEAENGGVIYNKSSCLVSNVHLYDSIVSSCGGAIYNDGAFYYNSGTLSGNECGNYGGGIYSSEGSVLKMENGDITSCTAKYGGGIYSLGTFTMTGGSVGRNFGSAPQIAIFDKFEMGGSSVFYSGDVLGLVRKADGSFPHVTLKSALTDNSGQYISLYKLSGGKLKQANSSGVTVFEGSEELIASAVGRFEVQGGKVFPYRLAKNGEMKLAFPTVLVIVSASALAVGAIGFVVGKKVVKVKK